MSYLFSTAAWAAVRILLFRGSSGIFVSLTLKRGNVFCFYVISCCFGLLFFISLIFAYKCHSEPFFCPLTSLPYSDEVFIVSKIFRSLNALFRVSPRQAGRRAPPTAPWRSILPSPGTSKMFPKPHRHSP